MCITVESGTVINGHSPREHCAGVALALASAGDCF